MGEVDVGEFINYCELPDDLTEEILAWLPADYLYRFCSVCKKWKELFTSTRFITTQWVETPPNKDPLLMLVHWHFQGDCFAYSSFTQSWKRSPLSLSFLEEREPATSRKPSVFQYIASGAGLFLVRSIFSASIYVCNPLTGKCLTLSHLQYTKDYLMGIVQEGKDEYKVVAVHQMLRGYIVEIYDSREKVWKAAGAFQENLTLLIGVKERGGLVFSGLGFFCTLVSSHGVEGIVTFDMVEGTCIFVPFPRPTDNHSILFSNLVSCGSRILLVGRMNVTRIIGNIRVVIWEYIDDALPKWEVIATMPPTVLERSPPGRELGALFDCAGMGDCIYFRFQGNSWELVEVYNLSQNSWSMLPECSFPEDEYIYSSPLFSFSPRLDMKVH